MVVNVSNGTDFSFNLPGLRGAGGVCLSAAIVWQTSLADGRPVMTGVSVGIGGLGTGHWRLRFGGTLTIHGFSSVAIFSLPDVTLVGRALWSIYSNIIAWG